MHHRPRTWTVHRGLAVSTLVLIQIPTSPSLARFLPLRPPDMDPIEPVEGSTAPASVPEQSEASSSRPQLATTSRPRAPSNRTRRPSIRLSRLPSVSSLDTVNIQQQQPQTLSDNQPGPSLTRQVSVRSPVQEEDESWQGGRRRSNSEPRPGRWSSPQNVLTRVATPMGCLTEESSHQSPMPESSHELTAQQTADDQLQPPLAALARPASRNVLRRTSQAALNRFSRNRASTVSGAPPALEATKKQPVNEYGSHIVDVLDVIGKSYRTGPEDRVPIIVTNNITILIRSGGLGLIHPY